MKQSPSPLSVLTGIALIVLPLVAWGFKFFSFGWMMFIVIFGPILVLILGYALQIVIAVQGFLIKGALFGGTGDAGGLRARIAAWASSIAFVLLGIFMPDGGDMYFGSTFQVWLGAYGPNADAVHAATDGLTGIVAFFAAVVWLAAFVWLAVEWILALSARRRARLAA